MKRLRPLSIALTVSLVGLAACEQSTSPDELITLGAAFSTTPAGFGDVASSFSAGDDTHGLPWQPERGRGGPRMMGGRGGPGLGLLMGGGMHPNFLGGVAFGRGPDRGPFAVRDTTGCTFSSSTGDITCGPYTRGGLSVTRILTYATQDGTAQSRFDSTTHSARTRVSASGTIQRRDSVSATVSHTSDRTVTGLSIGSTQRTVNGTSQGQETATGTTRDGAAFSAERAVGDTTVGLVIPLENGRPTYPTAGTVTRSMRVAMTVDGATRTSSRREVITYNGTATASLVITQDGTTKTCTLPLPMGRPTCE